MHHAFLQEPSKWKWCRKRWKIGAAKIPTATNSIKPQYIAKIPANTFPASVCKASTGPMPPISIAAFKKASTHV